MRFIDLDLVQEAQGGGALIDAAEQARSRVAIAATEADRDDAIEASRDKWVAFRALFQQLFGAKCWYTECENPGTDDDIDHYRPKGRVAESPNHGGYWWEALNWRNFRLSCHRANRLRVNPDSGNTHGKGDHFPLIDETVRCFAPADDLERELPTLLDPTNPMDPPLLTFNIDGTIAVAAKYAGNLADERRVADSRIHLHLEWPLIKEGRQAIYRRVLTRVADGDRAEARWNSGQPAGKEALRAVIRDLLRLTHDREPFSRAARAFVRTFRDHAWIDSFVMPHIPQEPQ